MYKGKLVILKMRTFPDDYQAKVSHVGLNNLPFNSTMEILNYLFFFFPFPLNYVAVGIGGVVITAIGLFCLCILCAVIVWVCESLGLDKYSFFEEKTCNCQEESKQTHKKEQKKQISIESESMQLRRKLLILLHNDLDTAKRLLRLERSKLPGKDEVWYLKKVIWDLERDRY